MESLNLDVVKNFLIDRDATGKFIVFSKRTGKKYFVEPIGGHAIWGDLNPATKKVEGEYGKKYPGSIKEEESVITEENGFKNIITLKPGESPLEYIDRIDKRYSQVKD